MHAISDKVKVLVPCAIIEHEGRIFAAQRNANTSLALKWEFPGGKLEEGETLVEGLAREIREELSIDIQIGVQLQTTVRDDVWREIHLVPFVSSLVPGETIVLTEHLDMVWLNVDELYSLDWAHADRGVVATYLEYLEAIR